MSDERPARMISSTNRRLPAMTELKKMDQSGERNGTRTTNEITNKIPTKSHEYKKKTRDNKEKVTKL